MTVPDTRPAHRPSTREAMLEAAEAHLGADGTLTLDSAARAAGVTKPGLMYHFGTKEQLLSAVLDRIAGRYEAGMSARLAARTGTPPPSAPEADAAPGTRSTDFVRVPAAQRHLVYLDWAGRAPLSPADLVIFADPHLRVQLTRKWQEQLDRWLSVPEGTPPGRREHLLTVRLMADGLWFDRASGLLEISPERADALHAIADELLAGAP